MRSDLLERVMQPPTPDRLRRIEAAERMGRCPIEARQRTRATEAETRALIEAVIDLRAKDPQPSIREIAELTGYGKSTIGRIVAEFGL